MGTPFTVPLTRDLTSEFGQHLSLPQWASSSRNPEKYDLNQLQLIEISENK